MEKINKTQKSDKNQIGKRKDDTFTRKDGSNNIERRSLPDTSNISRPARPEKK